MSKLLKQKHYITKTRTLKKYSNVCFHSDVSSADNITSGLTPAAGHRGKSSHFHPP